MRKFPFYNINISNLLIIYTKFVNGLISLFLLDKIKEKFASSISELQPVSSRPNSSSKSFLVLMFSKHILSTGKLMTQVRIFKVILNGRFNIVQIRVKLGLLMSIIFGLLLTNSS